MSRSLFGKWPEGLDGREPPGGGPAAQLTPPRHGGRPRLRHPSRPKGRPGPSATASTPWPGSLCRRLAGQRVRPSVAPASPPPGSEAPRPGRRSGDQHPRLCLAALCCHRPRPPPAGAGATERRRRRAPRRRQRQRRNPRLGRLQRPPLGRAGSGRRHRPAPGRLHPQAIPFTVWPWKTPAHRGS